MKIVQFIGGLGNQMFQYAFYCSLQKYFSDVKADTSEFKTYSLHNGFELEHIFLIRLNKINCCIANLYNKEKSGWFLREIRQSLGIKKKYFDSRSQAFSYLPSIYSHSGTRYYVGYWQNESYFKFIEQDLRRHFTFAKPLKGYNGKIADWIYQNTQSVAVHVRRGDYLKNQLLRNICDVAYYQQAVELLESHVENPVYLIFSNDIQWCKENLKIKGAAHYVDWNTGKDSYLDMQLMSLCKHQIIANSSFSWWAAWLNNNPNKIVIAPKKWTNDPFCNDLEIVPKTWLKI